MPLRYHKIEFDWSILKSFHFIQVVRSALPLLASNTIVRCSPLIERYLASGMAAGTISLLGYANQLTLTLTTIVSSSIATTIFPTFVDNWQAGNKELMKKFLLKSISVIAVLSLPIISVFFLAGEELIRLFFQRGTFTSQDSLAVYQTMLVLMPYFFFTSLGNVLGRFLYASRRTVFVSVLGVVEIVLYILLGFFLLSFFDYKGLALALSISTFFSVIANLILINKIIPGTFQASAISVARTGIVCLLSCAIVVLVQVYLKSNFISSILLFVGFFLTISTWIIKIPETAETTSHINQLIKKIWKNE